MSNEQKLREALQGFLTAMEQGLSLHLAAEYARQALATTEPEPTGMPELHPVAHIELGDDSHDVVTLEAAKAYGEQCWKAGYKHGAWGDKPAVNQQLTTEPGAEREAFEKWLGIKPCGAAHDFGWSAWQARAAMAQVSDINVVESFTNDTKDAKRYRWLRDDTDSDWAICEWSHDPGDEGYYRDARAPHIVDAAIDAAMAQGVK